MKTNLTNKEYWILRQDQRLEEVEALGGKGINEIVGVYDDSLKRVEKEINTILRNYAKNSNISIESLKEFLTESEQSGLLERLQLNMYNTGILDKQTEKWLKTNYQFRLDRQTALKQQLEAERIMVLKQERAISKKLYSKGIEQTYSSLTKDLIGASKDISDAVKESMLTKRWIADNNYSERIWNNTGQLKNDLDQMLNATNLAGRNPQQLINDLKDRYEVSQHQAARLVRTEMNYFHNQTTLKGYEDAGIEEYEYSAVRDNRTSAVCSDMDGNKHKIKDAEPGVNYPPMHPNCRSTTVPVIPGYEIKERRYKNPITGEGEVTDLSYEDWLEQSLYNDLKTSKLLQSYDSNDDIDVPDFMKKRNVKIIKPIYNSDEIVNEYYNKLQFKTDNPMIHDKVKEGIRLMPERDLKLLKEIKIVIVEELEEKGGSARTGIKLGNIDLLKPRISIKPGIKNPAVFAHEFAHIISNEKSLMKNQQFLNIIKKSIVGARYNTMNIRGVDYMTVESNKFLSKYQGRTYIKASDFKGSLEIEDLREFVSVGYEYFVKNPQLLYNINKDLYIFFESGGLVK